MERTERLVVTDPCRKVLVVADDLDLNLRTMSLANRLRELPVDVRGKVLDAWENILEATLHPTVLVVSRRNSVATEWCRVVEEVGGTGQKAVTASEVSRALYSGCVQAVLLDVDYLDHLRVVTLIRAREAGIPVLWISSQQDWVLGTNSPVPISPDLNSIRQALAEVLHVLFVN